MWLFNIFSVLLTAVLLQTVSCQCVNETSPVCRPLLEICGLSGKGEKGDPGEKGLRGSLGPVGKAGQKGENGSIGPKGEKGDTGEQGMKGSLGFQGHTGPQGQQGSTGPKGDKGATGEQGMKGSLGFQGQNGSTGPKGDKGATGEQGMKGSLGFQGHTGPQGEKGSTGPKGDKGATGEQGMKGSLGYQGYTGPQGQKGSTGSKGDKGATGYPADMSRVSTLERKVRALEGIMKLQGVTTSGKYFFTNGKTMNYEDGLKECSNAGGRLAAPTNFDQNNAILKFVIHYNTYAYLGISDIAREGRFVYLDGQSIVYSNWYEGEPDSYYDYEDCVNMYTDGTWGDYKCTSNFLIICEF